MYRRDLIAPKSSFFLFGPRGTGKSTWIKQNFPKAHVVNLLEEEVYQTFLAEPGLFGAELNSLKSKSWVVVDEIQRLPNLLNEVHRAIEDKKLNFVLCGSSARKLRREGVNLLAGRALNCHMYPFLPSELGDDFELSSALRYGLLPIVQQAKEPQQTLNSYVQMYLKQEIQAEALVRNLPGFSRFLPVAALFHGQVLNISNIARDAQVSRTTISGFIEILEDTLLALRLPAFDGKLRVKERKHPKFYLVDPGLVRAFKKRSTPVIQEEKGPLLEGLIGQCLRVYGDYQDLFQEMYYWAPSEANETEVEFLLEREGKYLALEVKAKTRLDKKDLKGLHAIQELKGIQKRMVVYLGTKKLRFADGIEAIPVTEFFTLLAKNQLW